MTSVENRISSCSTRTHMNPIYPSIFWHRHCRYSIPSCSQSVISSRSPKARRSTGWNSAPSVSDREVICFPTHITWMTRTGKMQYDHICRHGFQPNVALFPISSSSATKRACFLPCCWLLHITRVWGVVRRGSSGHIRSQSCGETDRATEIGVNLSSRKPSILGKNGQGRGSRRHLGIRLLEWGTYRS